jgi:plasmid maintenance system antidote protein VapI
MNNYKALNHNRKEIFTDVALHPGEILQLEIEARELKKIEFANQLGMKPGI